MTFLRLPSVRSAAGIIGGLLFVSVLGGVVWGLLAPPEQLLVMQPNRGAALTNESTHQFDAIGILAWIALVVGVVSAVAIWTVLRRRGPLSLAALLIGSAGGAVLMAVTGLGVAQLRFPKPDSAAVGTIVSMAPGLPGVGSWMVLVIQPFVACVVTLVMVVLSPHDDLGVADSPEKFVKGPDLTHGLPLADS